MIILGLLIIIFSFGVIIPHTIILQLVLSVIVSYTLVIAVSIFTAEVIQNPEIALVSNIGIYLVMYIVEDENFFSGAKVFYPELEFFQSNYSIWIVASLITTVILLLTAFFVYLRRDIEL
ncbi:MAG: hypothetical protein HeimC2_02480 [Candidatus Heimdallarchaeota archaeon LC_2]|nr:MAG: hypothetical protein HeimC2_02480 [Candidatus Heimdallarchaeota archaeon LC_2]